MDGEDQYMDDLFGESEHVPNITAPAPALVKGLSQRFDELAGSNCCSRIAWSRFGCIAAVREGGRGVDLHVLVRNPKDGTWHLNKPAPLWPPLPDNQQVVHVAWSHMGNDLAVVDSAGRMLVYSTGYSLGQMVLMRNAMNEQDDEMNSLVGLHWLPVFPHTQKSGMFWSASRNNENWSVKTTHHVSPGPYNPSEGKSALVCLTRNGVLRLLYQQRDSKWVDTSIELGDASSAVSYSFTHASFAPDNDNSLLLVAYQVKGSVRIYHITINWNESVKQENGQEGHPSPSLDVKVLLEESVFAPISLPTNDQDDSANGGIDMSVSYQLSQLIFVPLAPEQGTKEPTQRTVIATFTVVPPHSSVLIDTPHQYQQATSIICRWELHKDLIEKLSPCFDLLGVKKKATSGIQPRKRARLKRLEDLSIAPAVLSILPVRNSTMFALTLSDGSVQFRWRNTFEVIMPDDSPDEAQTLPQSGFAFQPIDPFLNTAFSPGACVLAALKSDGEVKLEKMQYVNGSLVDMTEDDAKLDAIAAVFALQYASASMQYKSTDDFLSILPPNLSKALSYQLVLLTSEFLNVSFDYVADDNQKQIPLLFRHHLLFKCLSLHNALASADKEGPRKLAARLSWITINLRLVAFNISMNLRSNENLKAEMAISFVGLVKWSVDLCTYLLQEMFSIYYAIKHEAHDYATRREAENGDPSSNQGYPDRARDREWIQARILSQHSPALIVLLSSIPRILLRMMFRPLRHGSIHSANGYKTSLDMEKKGAFHKLLHVYHTTPAAVFPLEEYLTEVDALVKGCYRSSSTSDIQRHKIEQKMFLSATIPQILMPAVTEMLTTKLESLMSKLDPGKIHVHDVSWLGLRDDKRTRQFHEKHIIDVIRKMPLARDVKLRVCPRCASVMEDLNTNGPMAMQMQQPWVWASHKVCVCFSSWTTPENKEEQEGEVRLG